jgi:hypothetical protein
MDFNAPQLKNASLLIEVSFELGSSVNDEKEEQMQKHSLQRTSSDHRAQRDFNT